MREIIFRGKSMDSGEWVFGCFCPPCNICFETIGDDPDIGQKNIPVWNDHAVEPESMGQYIGLTDKNGTKIFEGDIIKHHLCAFGQESAEIGKVHWDAERCAFLRTPGCKLLTSTCQCTYEVIGNVYDNPELCEEVK